MAKQVINTGSSANDRSGDPLRTAFTKVNANFDELYAALGADAAANELVNGTHIVSLGADGVLTMPDGLTIDNSVIGYSNSTTVTEETPGGTISSTTALENQVTVDSTNSIVISNITTQTNNDGVVTTTDSVGSTLTVNNTGASIKRYVEPDGPNNGSYFQISTTNSGAIMEGVNNELTGDTIGRVTVTQGVIDISTSFQGVDKHWTFDYEGTMVAPGRIQLGTDASIYGLGDFIGLIPANTSSAGLEIDGVNDATLAAMRDVTIRANAGSPWKNWTFNAQGDLELPAKFPVQFTAVFDAAHYNGGGTFQGDGTVSFNVQLQGLGAQFQWLVDDPTFETDHGYVGQQAFRYTEADHGITGVNVDILVEVMGPDLQTGLYSLQAAFSPPPGPADLAKIRSTDELIVSSGTKGWIFDVNGNVYLPAGGDIRDSTGTSVLGGASYDQSLNTNNDVTFSSVTSTTNIKASEYRLGNYIRSYSSAPVNIAGAAADVVYSFDNWFTSAKIIIQVEGNVDGDLTFVDHTQTCEAVIAATYNTTAEPVMTVYGIVHTSVAPLATFTIRRGTGIFTGKIELVAQNSQTTSNITVKVQAVQFVSRYD